MEGDLLRGAVRTVVRKGERTPPKMAGERLSKETKMKHALFVLILAGSLLSLAGVANDEYKPIGSTGCKKCHLKQFKSWQETKMAQTFEVLKPGKRSGAKKKAGLDPSKDYTTDAECLACHVTSFGKPGGFTDIKKTPDLAGVGCESCHGPGGEYTKDEHMSLKNKEYKLADVVAVGLEVPVREESCTACHNEKSPFFKGFDFDARKDEGIHERIKLRYKHD